jgi:hypothetical protein
MGKKLYSHRQALREPASALGYTYSAFYIIIIIIFLLQQVHQI